jgi:hypothetical protein
MDVHRRHNYYILMMDSLDYLGNALRMASLRERTWSFS